MAHERYTRTNQKLFFAARALESWCVAEEGGAMNAQALVQAEREAALFHLYGALLGLCHEVAGCYGLPEAGMSRVELLLNPQMLASAPSPELAELVELAQQETWLAALLATYQALFLPPQVAKQSKLDPSLALITATSMEDEALPLQRETLASWRQSLQSLVLRYRETLSES